MASVKSPSPGLYAAVLHALGSTDPRRGSLASTMSGLAKHLTAADAARLAAAIEGVLPLLRRDAERLRFAAELASRLGFFETAGVLADLAITTGDRRLLLTAATLCGNPAVESSIRGRIADFSGDDPAVLIRLYPDRTPTTADEQLLYKQCWPGARRDDSPLPLAPVVVLDQGFDALRSLRFAISLDQAGAVVRRLAPDSEIPMWFGSQTVLVCEPRTRTQVLSAYPRFPEAQIIPESLPKDARQLGVLLRRVDAALPGSQKLRFSKFPLEVSYSLWNPDVFTAGVYPTKEVAFLSGATRWSLDKLRKRKLLTPLSPGTIRWAFRDLVAFRTWSYLKSLSPRRVSSDVVPALARFAGDEKAIKLGVTSEGAILVDHGDGWSNVETGQRPFDMDITDVDDVFQPFSYGGGRTLALPNASPNTTLHPSVLHGTPHLKGHRISAKSLASLSRHNGRRAILSAYPELENVSFDDTVAIGDQLLATA